MGNVWHAGLIEQRTRRLQHASGGGTMVCGAYVKPDKARHMMRKRRPHMQQMHRHGPVRSMTFDGTPDAA
jgi:hypothetical protein